MWVKSDRVLLLIWNPFNHSLNGIHVYRVPDFRDNDGLVEILIRSSQSNAKDLRRESNQAQGDRFAGPRGNIVIRQSVLRRESMRPISLHGSLMLHVALVPNHSHQRGLLGVHAESAYLIYPFLQDLKAGRVCHVIH